MKKITLTLLFAFAGLLAFGQQLTEYEKIKLEQALEQGYEKAIEAEKVPSMDRAPLNHSAVYPGYVQQGFKTGSVGYGWNAYGGTSGIPDGPVSVAIPDGTLTSIAAVEDPWMTGGDFADETWYAVNYDVSNSGLYTINPETGAFTLVGSTGASLTGLAFDPVAGVMYGSAWTGSNSTLRTVDLGTGASTEIGVITSAIIIGIAGDADGNIYGIGLDDNLYSINTATGAGTVIGGLGYAINYAQDIGFDRDNDILYGTLYTTTGGFYEINVSTGAATLLYTFGAEVCAFGIPYTVAEPGAPDAVSEFNVTVAEMGVLEATLTWTNPSTTVDGDPLTELTSIVIERGGEVIETISNPEIGEADSFVDDDVPAAGIYTYRIYGVNSAGEGLKTALSVYVGEDVPAAPTAVELLAQGNDGVLTWQAPTEGLNGGYFTGTGITYTLTRYPGATVVATDIAETTFTDDNITQVGVYFYTVLAKNAVGDGGLATSNSALLGAEGVVFMMDGEVTSCEGMFYDSGGPGSDYQNNENFTLTFFPEQEGAKMRFNFTAFNVESNVGCTWDALEVFDGPNTSATLVGRFCGTTVPAELVELTSTHETGAITFRFTSDGSVTRPGWEASFSCYVPADNDLRGIAISGNTTPTVGTPSTYAITVFNEGSAPQLGSAYTVELRDADHNVLATADGVDIDSDQVLNIDVTWTPDEEGPMSVYGYVNFPGDDVPGNNSTPLLNLNVQPAGIIAITIGTANTVPDFRIPFDFYWMNSLSQVIYYEQEMQGVAGFITGLTLTNSFATNLPNKAIQIFAAHTDATDLSGGFVPGSDFELVFDGNADFPSGVNTISITFDDPFLYTGGNLVLMFYRVWENEYFNFTDRFFATETPAYPNRVRHVQADGTVYDPLNPPTGGTLRSHVPNTTLFLDASGLGSIAGVVTDEDDDPIEGVLLTIEGVSTQAITNADGEYLFPYVTEGEKTLTASKFGYFSETQQVLVEMEEQSIADFVLEAIPQYAVEGIAQGNDDVLLEGAEIWLEGYDDYYAVADEDGAFMFTGVYAGTYDLTIAIPNYLTYNAVVEVEDDLDLGTIILTEILAAPYGLTIDPYDQGEGNALFTWNDMQLVMLFQHDGELPAAPNAYYQTNARGYGVVYDLTAFPDAIVEMIDFHHLQWGLPNNTYPYLVHIINWETKTIVETVGPFNTLVNDAWEEAVNLGSVNVAGISQLAILIQPQGNTPTDAYPCLTGDASGPAGVSLYAPMDDLNAFVLNPASMGDFFLNLWISTAFEPGKVVKANRLSAEQIMVNTRMGEMLSASELSCNGQTIVLPQTAEKVFTGFNVYLNDMEIPVEAGIPGTSYLFTDLEEGDYTAGVSAVYTTGMSEIVTIDFIIAFGVDVTVAVTTNSGDSAEGAEILLENQVETQFVYSGTAGADGTLVFENLRKGTYTLTVNLNGFNEFVQEDLVIDDVVTIDVELTEIIVAPFGLLVVEGENAGEAHFSWNNILGLESFADSFEDGTFDAWHAFIQGPGTPGESGNAYWHVSDYASAPDGAKIARADWGYNIDTWLITPAIGVESGYTVSFHWASSYFWSVSPNPNAELMIKVSTDGGDTWTELWNWQNIGEWTNWQWYQTSVDLSAYAGQAVHVAIHLLADDNAETMIDNVVIGGGSKVGTFALGKPANVEKTARSLPEGVSIEKAFLSYNVFLDDMVTPVATQVATTNFLFTGLTNGDYVAGVQSVYSSGASEIVTLPFTVTNGIPDELFTVTFNVHMHAIEFDPDADVFYITGSMHDWASPGSQHDDQVLTVTDDPMIYTITMELEGGTHQYKFFKNAGWNGGEWPGQPDRELLVDEDMVVDHVFGDIDDPVNVPVLDPGMLSVFPNPVSNVLHVVSGDLIREIRLIDMLGQVVYNSSVQADRHELNVSGFRNGIYFVQVLTTKGVTTHRIQIVK